MKGVEESLSQTIFFIGSIIAAALLIFLAFQYLSGFNKENNTELSGNKIVILGEIKNIVLDCWDKNSGRKDSQVCSKTYLTESLNISSAELISYLKNTELPASYINAEDLIGPSQILITYQNSQIFIEKR